MYITMYLALGLPLCRASHRPTRMPPAQTGFCAYVATRVPIMPSRRARTRRLCVLGAICECHVKFAKALRYCVDVIRVTCQDMWHSGWAHGARVALTCHIGGYVVFSTARVQLSILFDTTSWLASCACAMTDTAEGRTSGAEQSPIEVVPAASSASTSPVPAPSEPSSADGVFVNFHGREE